MNSSMSISSHSHRARTSNAELKNSIEKSSLLSQLADNVRKDINEIQIYQCELEKVKEFSNAFSMLDTFELWKGKNHLNKENFKYSAIIKLVIYYFAYPMEET